MDLSYSPEDEAFRQHVRKWIAEHAPKRADMRDLEASRAWQRTLHAAGFLGVGWPAEYGGAKLTKLQQCAGRRIATAADTVMAERAGRQH